MKRLLLPLFIFIFIALCSVSEVHAINNPSEVTNNIYGIHISNKDDLNEASELVGKWGYFTVVITEAERDKSRWQEFFNEARRLHLIPIVRIASRAEDGMWVTPSLSEIDSWVSFLDSLNWVIENRYIIISNEPNHAKEWGGMVNPEEYSDYLNTFATKLKEKNSDFFVMAAGLDASAPNEYINRKTQTFNTMDEEAFLSRMIAKNPNVFGNIDGLSSHSYPNPAFMGSASATGRGTIKTYEWELGVLKNLGITKELPVFITETGWSHKVGKTAGLTETEVSERMKFAFENVWLQDQKIIAVTPFIINYSQTPFDNFSWINADGQFYAFGDTVKNLPKNEAAPIQKQDGEILGSFMIPVHTSSSTFPGFSLVKNTGQTIWENTTTRLVAEEFDITTKNTSYSFLEPTQVGTIFYDVLSPSKEGIYSLNLSLSDGEKQFGRTYNSKIIIDNSPSVKFVGLFDKILDIVRDSLNKFKN